MRGHFLRAAQKGDANALAYIAAVETADGQALEAGVKTAINAFVVGCKTDGIWNAIKASCVLAGARTLAGALVPLVGTAPTSINFTSSDYNRKTGLLGDGATKYLDSNRSNTADPQNSRHISAYVTAAGDANLAFVADRSPSAPGRTFIANGQATVTKQSLLTVSAASAPCLAGASRPNSSTVIYRVNSSSTSYSHGPSEAPDPAYVGSYRVYIRTTTYNNCRIAFYSIGESIDLALLDARVTTLMTAFAAAIP